MSTATTLAPPENAARPYRVGFVTLGCDKNTVDNEYLAGLLAGAGCELVVDDDGALDAAIVTTCGFIGPAKEQSIDAIVQLAEKKRETGSPRRLFVAGCLSQRYGQELIEEIPEIDGMVGVGQYKRLAEMICAADDKAEANRPRLELAATPTVDIYKLMRRVRLDGKPHAFLKISDGCNHGCTFCSIPIMKGKLRSVPSEILIEEVRALLAQGVKEINLVAQDLSMYGMDRRDWDKGERLPKLLREICALPGDFWVRCLYYYPGLVTDEFLDTMAGEPKIVKYLDMPLQHLDPGTLRRMKRPFHEVSTTELIPRMRARVPGLTLRTTMIIGFPGETEAEHKNMLARMKEMRFDWLGAFRYSPEDGTPAETMEKQCTKSAVERRWHAAMETQQAITAEHNRARVGERTRILIEGFNPEQNAWEGRSPREAPEIDGKVFLRLADHADGWQPERGSFVDAEIIEAGVYDVFGRVTDK